MRYGRICKEYMVSELSKRMREAKDIFVTDFTGLKGGELQQLRQTLRKNKAVYLVIKNSIGKRALKDCGFDAVATMIEGSVGLVLSKEDPVTTSKALVSFSKKTEPFKIKGGYVDGEIFDEAGVKQLALLPTREVLLSMVIGTIRSPINGLVNVLAGTLHNFVYVLEQIKKKKQ